jgi:hypothetical protein
MNRAFSPAGIADSRPCRFQSGCQEPAVGYHREKPSFAGFYCSSNIIGDMRPALKTSCTVSFGSEQCRLPRRLMSHDEKNISATSAPLRCDQNRRDADLRRGGHPANPNDRTHGMVACNVLRMMCNVASCSVPCQLLFCLIDKSSDGPKGHSFRSSQNRKNASFPVNRYEGMPRASAAATFASLSSTKRHSPGPAPATDRAFK